MHRLLPILFFFFLLSQVHTLPLPLDTCTLSQCAYLSSRGQCTSPTPPNRIISCAYFHTTLSKTACNFRCPSLCQPASLRPVGSDGIAYCTECSLQQASCNSAFTISGPLGVAGDLQITETATPQTIGPVETVLPVPNVDMEETPLPSVEEEDEEEDLIPSPIEESVEPECGEMSVAQCCKELGIGCLSVGEKCSTTIVDGKLPVACTNGLICVLGKLEPPNQGICVDTGRDLIGECIDGVCEGVKGNRAACTMGDIARSCSELNRRRDKDAN